MPTFTGGCLCGEVRFEYQSPSLWCAHCHCSLCQQAHGAPLVTWVGVAEQRFTMTADRALRWYHSSADSQRGFCTNCGTTLFFSSKRWLGEMHIVRTNIEGEIDAEPALHVHCESRANWLVLGDSLPRQDG